MSISIKSEKVVESAFREELQALLKKYGATLEIEERSSRGYSEYREPYLAVSIPSIYCEETREYKQEAAFFELGSFLSPEVPEKV